MIYKNLEQLNKVKKYITDVYYSHQWSNGMYTEMIKKSIRDRVLWGRQVEVLPTVNGTFALWMALCTGGDIVMVPDLAAVAVWLASAGKTVVTYSIENNWQPDLGIIEKFLEEERGTIPIVVIVHTGGIMVQSIDKVRSMCDSYGGLLVEDISHAYLCATKDGKKAGDYGHIVVGSMYATKSISSGEGGFIAYDPSAVDGDFLYALWNAGRNNKEEQVLYQGALNGRPSEFQVAVMNAVMDYLDESIEIRKCEAKKYDELLSSSINIPIRNEGKSSYYKYIVEGSPDKISELENTLPVYSMTGKVHAMYKGGVKDKYGEGSLSNRHICLNLFYEDKRSIADEVNRVLG